MNQAMVVQGKGVHRELLVLPLAASRFGLPERYDQALALFEAARHEYEQGKPAKAAPKFLEVAKLLEAPKTETTYSASFAKMRAVAYEDASIAFLEAEAPAERKKALLAAQKKDKENRAVLEKLLGE